MIDLMQELVNNGHAILSIERTLKGIEDSLTFLKQKIKHGGILKESLIISAQLQKTEEQYYIMKSKHEQLLQARDKIIHKICDEHKEEQSASLEAVTVIDNLVMKLLEIDDKYMDAHNSSNASIMAFVEELLTKKRTLIKEN